MVDALAVSCSASDQPARVDTRSPACQPPGERDPPGMEAQEVRRRRQFSHRRDVYMMRRKMQRKTRKTTLHLKAFCARARTGFAGSCRICKREGAACASGGQKVRICHENGGWYANARQTCSHHGSLGRDDTFSGRSGAWTQCVTLATEAGATRPDRCYVLPPSTSVRPRCCITLQTDRTAK